MHHCQIDRMFAIWQAVHEKEKESWFREPELAGAPLLPFRKEAGDKDFWNSNQSRKTKEFGYTYPETQGTGQATIDLVNNMYQWSIPDRDSHDITIIPPEMEPIDVDKTQFFEGMPRKKKVDHTESLSKTVAIQEQQPALIQRVEHQLKESSPILMHSNGPTYSWDWYIDDKVQRSATTKS